MPDELASQTDVDGNWFPLLRQIQLTLVSAAAGLTVAADVVHWGFDTHANHDAEQGVALRNLAAGIDYLWAEAARMDTDYQTNLVDRLRVVVASDFSRTPWYNDGNGKDHWPIGSAILMQNSGFSRKVVWGNNGDARCAGFKQQFRCPA